MDIYTSRHGKGKKANMLWKPGEFVMAISPDTGDMLEVRILTGEIKTHSDTYKKVIEVTFSNGSGTWAIDVETLIP